MTSRKKANGCTTARRVMEAVRKCDCSLYIFFVRAGELGKVPDGYDCIGALKEFEKLAEHGHSAVPGYKIPEHVLQLTNKIHENKNPLNYFRSLEAPARPAPVSAG